MQSDEELNETVGAEGNCSNIDEQWIKIHRTVQFHFSILLILLSQMALKCETQSQQM